MVNFPRLESSSEKLGNDWQQPSPSPVDTSVMLTPLLFRLAFRFDDRLLAELAWLLELGDLKPTATC